MGLEQEPNAGFFVGNFFHVLPVDELEEYNHSNVLYWESQHAEPKVMVERFLEQDAGFFPNRMVIPRIILSPQETDRIQSALLQGIQDHYSMGVRSVANKSLESGDTLPWIMELDSSHKVDVFLHDTLPSWNKQADEEGYELTKLILMKNPPELGTMQSNPDQFVARLQWINPEQTERDLPHTLMRIEMAVGTNKLRELDRRMEKPGNGSLIRYEGLYSLTDVFSHATIDIGNTYVNPACMEKARSKMSFVTDQALTLKSADKIDPYVAATMRSFFSFLQENINDPNIQLLKRFDFLASIGLTDIEFQGFNNHKWGVYIYGLRGMYDETRLNILKAECFKSRS